MAATHAAPPARARTRTPRPQPASGGPEVVRVRIDRNIKIEAVAVLDAMGLSVSDAMRMLLVRVAREKSLPVELITPNETTIAAMREARAGGMDKFKTVGDLMASLNEDD